MILKTKNRTEVLEPKQINAELKTSNLKPQNETRKSKP